MSRSRIGLVVVAMTVIALAVPGAFTAGNGVANAAPIPGGDITTVCAGTIAGTTFTLTADCGEVTTSLTVPPTITTVDGAGHIISATDLFDPTDPTDHTLPQWTGAIVTNAGPGQTMNIQNVTITGPGVGFQDPAAPATLGCDAVLYGIFFNGAAGGSVSNVVVQHIFQFPNVAFGACQTGRAIRADNSGTITITGTTVTDYQKSGFEARGSTIMNVSGSTAGPSHSLEALIAQNGVSIVGAAGTVANNTIYGSGYTQTVGGLGASTAVLLFGAHDVTVTNNTLTSPPGRPGTDIGISVVVGSSNIVISFNQVNRLGPDVPDDVGIGIDVFTPDGSMATLICNTFSQWRLNVVGAEQIACTPLPDGIACRAYSAPAPAVDSGLNYAPTTRRFLDPDVLPLLEQGIIDATPFTWTVDSGTLPPGLSLSSVGAITGTPTVPGTFNFTLRLVDSTGLTATQAKTITIAPENCSQPPIPPIPEPPTPTPEESNVRVLKRWVGTPSTATIFVDQDGSAPFDTAVRADSEGDATHWAYPLSTRVTVGEVQVPPGFTATINCGGGRQPYTGGPFSVQSPPVAGRTRLCTIVNTQLESLIVVDKKANKRTVREGQNVDFVITVRNAGQAPATNVRVCDRLPNGLQLVRAQGVRFQRGDACWTIRQLAPGRTWRVTVSMEAVRVSQRRELRNVVVVVSPDGRVVCAARATAAAGQRRAARIAACPVGVAVLPAAARGGGVTG